MKKQMKALGRKKNTLIKLLLLVAVLFLLPNAAHAGIGAGLVTAVLKLMLAFSGWVLGVAMDLVDMVISSALFDYVFFSDPALRGINAAWGLVRDFVNMFFILVLVFLAIATILRINKFSDKRLLFYVIIAALLVNFSKPITLFIIDASNLAMAFFITNMKESSESYSGALLHAVKMKEVYNMRNETMASGNTGVWLAMLVAFFFQLIMAVMLFFLALTLVVRLVALWVILIISPLAFFSIAMPGSALARIKDTWFTKLIHWCFYGPVMLFFFWIALVMASAMAASTQPDATNDAGQSTEVFQLPSASTNGQSAGGQGGFVIKAIGIVIPYAATIYLLFYGYALSKSVASAAGDGALGLLNRGSRTLSRAGGRAAAIAGAPITGRMKAAQAGLNQRDLPFTKTRREKKMKAVEAFAGGKSSQAKLQATNVNEQLKKWDDEGAPKADGPGGLKEILKGTDKKDLAKRQAAALRLAKNGDLDSTSYRDSMTALAGNEKLSNRFQGNAKNKNMYAKLEYDGEAAITQKKKDMGSGYTDADGAKAKQAVYTEELKKMDLKQIKNQNLDFHQTKEFENYMKNRIAMANDPAKEKARLNDQAEGLDEGKARAWDKFLV